MMFVVAHLSPSRLAPKLLEQFELPVNTSAEVRLLRLIAKVPGPAEIGPGHRAKPASPPGLRNALAGWKTEFATSKPEDIRAIIQRDLGS